MCACVRVCVCVWFFEWCIYIYKVNLANVGFNLLVNLSVGPEKLWLFSAINIQYLLPEEDPARCTTIQERVGHVGQFLRQHGSLVPFTQQGLEKFKDHLTKMFFQSTNMRLRDAMVQLLQKHNRIELLRDQRMALSTHQV